MHCVGEEEVEHEGKKVKAFRYEWRGLFGVASTFWIAPEGRTLVTQGGNRVLHRTTKEAALKGIDPRIKPRTAD